MMHFKSSLKLLGLLICEAQWQLKDDCPQRERRLGGGDGVPGGLREHRDRASAYFGHAPFHWSTFRHFIIVHSRIFDRLCIPCKQFAHLFLLILLLTIILAWKGSISLWTRCKIVREYKSVAMGSFRFARYMRSLGVADVHTKWSQSAG